MAETTFNIDALKDKGAEEIALAVAKEVQSIGANTKANYEEMQKTYSKLKETVDKQDKNGEDWQKAIKLAAEVSTRQEEMDKGIAALKASQEAVEVMLKRAPIAGDMSAEKREKLDSEIKCFAADVLSIQKKGLGVTAEDLANFMKTDVPTTLDNYRRAFEKFARCQESMITPEDRKDLSVGIDPDGGYTVTPAMSSRIIQKLYETDPIRQLASVESITGERIEMLVDINQADCGWETETVTGAKTNTARLEKKAIHVGTMYARPRATQQILEDSGINIESWLSNKIAQRLARTEAAAFVTGDGVGKPRGFLTYGNGTTYGTIEQVAMGAAANLTADGFVRIKYHLLDGSLGAMTAWLMNRTTVMAAMLLKNGMGDYIWKQGIQNDAQSNILGIPVRMSTTMPVVAANALSVALADWSETYMIVDRLGISVQRDPFTVKPFVEFYTRKRVGGDVVNFDTIKIGVISV